MEDFIYLILLIAWIAFAFYRKSQKNKAASPPRQRPQRAEKPEQTIGDIIFGESWHVDEEPEPLPFDESESPVATVRHPDSQEGVSLETLKPTYTRDLKAKADEPSEILLEDRPGAEEEQPEFRLRDAVIYDAILNRPYS